MPDLPPPDPAPAKVQMAVVTPTPVVTPPPQAERPAASAPPNLKETVLALYPNGQGDPDAITCRAPQALPGSRLPGPEICKTNRVWAALRAQGQDVSADGRSLIAMVQRFGVSPSVCYSGLLQLISSPGIRSETSILSACR